jgi:enterochelin esterase family protein
VTAHADGSPLLSPRLRALRRALAHGDTHTLPAFWARIHAKGAPLIEPLPRARDHHLVTFLWRGDPATTRNVAIVDGPGGDTAANTMRLLPGSDLWYRSYRLRDDLRCKYRLAPNDPLIPEDQVTDWATRAATWQPDPLNPHTFTIPPDPENPADSGSIFSLLELPAAPPQPYLAPRPGIPTGHVETLRLTFPAFDCAPPIHGRDNNPSAPAMHGREPHPRRIWLYTPPGYTTHPAEPYGLLLLLDGQSILGAMPTPTILDNLLADGRIPPLVALLIENPGDTRLQELLCSPTFTDYLADTLLPEFRAHCPITADPVRIIIAGQSAGGLAAAFAALHRPDTFGAVLSQSGSYWWRPEGDPAHQWLARQYVTAPRLPIRFYLDVGLLETHPTPGHGPTQLAANRHLRDTLRAKDYPLTYAEFNGGHDYLAWRRTLADGLIALTTR